MDSPTRYSTDTRRAPAIAEPRLGTSTGRGLPLMLGQRIRNYRIVREVGRGGMAVVYEATREDIGSRAALKILRPEYAANQEIAARFLNEARAANRIEHAGIVRIFDYGREPDGTIFLAMEFLEGETLYKRLKRQKQLSSADTIRLGRQIAAALAAAHQKGVIHRDLKPENILIVPEPEAPGGERVKVLDFGLAKLQAAMDSVRTGSNMLMGTPMYMSPEQCRSSRNTTDRSDVYALGTILFELLAGRLPFLAKDPGEYIVLHMYEPAPPLGSLVPSSSPSLQTLVDSMLDKTPERRPAMSAVVRVLRDLSGSIADQGSFELDLRKAAPRNAPAPSPSDMAAATAATLEAAVVPRPEEPPVSVRADTQVADAERQARAAPATESPSSQSSNSSPSLGERVLGRLREAGRRSFTRQREIGEELWSLLIRRGKKRRIVSAVALLGLIVGGVLGPFFLGRSSVKREPVKADPPRLQVPASPAPVPPAPVPPVAAPPVPPPAAPPLPPKVSKAILQSEALLRAGDTNDAIKALRRALAQHPHPQLWSALGQLACRKDRLSIANQALAKLPDPRRDTAEARRELLSVCKTFDILENKAGKLVKAPPPRTPKLRIRPVR